MTWGLYDPCDELSDDETDDEDGYVNSVKKLRTYAAAERDLTATCAISNEIPASAATESYPVGPSSS